jgi:hypothetical protein
MPTEMLTNMNGDLVIDKEMIPTSEEAREVWDLIEASKGKVLDDDVIEDLSNLLVRAWIYNQAYGSIEIPLNGDLIIDREIIPTAEEVTEVWSLIDASKGKVVDDKVLEDLSDLLVKAWIYNQAYGSIELWQ